jgi:hypothetical protein
VSYVLGRTGLFLNTASDVMLLPKILDAAARASDAPSEATMRQLMEKRSMAPLFV